MRILAVEETPNPNARKFILNEPISQQPMSFFNADTAKGYDLAVQLFAIKGVNTLLFLNDFVTINKSPEATWTDIIKNARKILEAKKD